MSAVLSASPCSVHNSLTPARAHLASNCLLPCKLASQKVIVQNCDPPPPIESHLQNMLLQHRLMGEHNKVEMKCYHKPRTAHALYQWLSNTYIDYPCTQPLSRAQPQTHPSILPWRDLTHCYSRTLSNARCMSMLSFPTLPGNTCELC